MSTDAQVGGGDKTPLLTGPHCRICSREFRDKPLNRRRDKVDPSRCKGCAAIAIAFGTLRRKQ